MTMKCHNHRSRSNKGTVRKKHRTFRSWLHFVILLSSSTIFKSRNMISIKVLIITEIAQLIPKCTWCFVDLSCMLNTLIFTVDNYFFKKTNVSLGLSQLKSSILTILIISYCKMLILLYSNFERNYFVC